MSQPNQQKSMIVSLLEGGMLQIPARILKRFRFTVDTKFGLLTPHPRLFWMLQDPDRLPFSTTLDQLSLSGYIASIGVADVFSILNMGQRTGALVFMLDEGEKSVFFERGEVLFATSTLPADRIGECLIRLGKLTSSQIEEAKRSIQPGQRFGAHLVQKGFVSDKVLHEAVRHQVEEILYSLFTLEQGVFMFFENATVDQDLVQFTLNTQNILMEGFQRVDEWEVLRKIISNDQVAPQRTDAPVPEKAPAQMRAILDAVDGERTVAQIMKEVGLGPFPVYRGLYEASKLKLVEFQDAVEEEIQTGTSKMVEDFNKLFRTAANEVLKHSEGSSIQLLFTEYVEGLPSAVQDVLQGVPLKKDGTFDALFLVTRVREIVKKKGGMSKIAGVSDLLEQKTMLNALNESLNFYLFTARNALPRQKSDRLIAAVRNVHKNLVERYKG